MTTKLEAAARLKADALTAAPIPYETAKKFMAELFKRAKLKELGFVQTKDEIFSVEEIDDAAFDKMEKNLKKLGFVKPWKKGSHDGLAREDGTWPLRIERLGSVNHSTVYILLTSRDTLDSGERKADRTAFKKVVMEVAKLLNVKMEYTTSHHDDTGFGGDVDRPNTVSTKEATKKLAPLYGKPQLRYSGQGSERKTILEFKKDYGVIVLKFYDSTELAEIDCEVY